MSACICPSSTLAHATHLLGVVGGDGRVHFVQPALPLSSEFRQKAAAGGSPERRFRFAGACLEDGCGQWTGTDCNVIDRVLDEVDVDLNTQLRPCIVRRACRWFAQRGTDACEACPFIVTDTRLLPLNRTS